MARPSLQHRNWPDPAPPRLIFTCGASAATHSCFDGLLPRQWAGMATIDVDALVEITVTKRLDDSSAGELRAAEDMRRRKALRHLAAADSLAAGRTPTCDWAEPGGIFCESPAVWIRHGSPSADELPFLCTAHRQAQELRDRRV